MTAAPGDRTFIRVVPDHWRLKMTHIETTLNSLPKRKEATHGL